MPLAIMSLSGAVAIMVAAVLLPVVAWVYLALVLAGAAVFGIVRGLAHRVDAAWVESRAALAERITDVLEGADELRAWNAAERSLDQCDAISVRSENLLARSARLVAAGRAAIVLAVGSAVAASLVAVSPSVDAGHLSAAMAALLVLAPLAMADLVSPAPDAAVVDVRTRRALDRLQSQLAQSPTVEEPEHPLPIAAGPESVEAVSVTAGWGRTPVLRSFDLSVGAGSRTGVVGPSGSGKSTLAALLVRFLDPTSGSVRYGEADLRSSSLDDVRRTVGLLDDDPHIFATTVAENVRFARPGSTNAEVASALRTARLGAWVDSLPAGLDTWVGEGNRAVSGGERARLGLARVILANQPVLVLDEPTAHLDRQTATEVMAALFQGAGGRSIVLITHRPEGLDLVDEVVSLDRLARGERLEVDGDQDAAGQRSAALVMDPR
jgi:ATP-binding cassette subfamily C protein CydCD